jgi:hypothetical protein
MKLHINNYSLNIFNLTSLKFLFEQLANKSVFKIAQIKLRIYTIKFILRWSLIEDKYSKQKNNPL